MINIKNKADCCGCGACQQSCPKNCITMASDGEGFLYPQVDGSLCVECDLCEKRCPVNAIPVATDVMQYAMMLCSATHPDSECASNAAKKYVRLGASPRAGQALISAAKVKALMSGRYNVSYSDINELAYPVLRHRMKLTFEAIAERVSPDEIVTMIIDELTSKEKLADEGKKATSAKAAEAVENGEDKKRKKFGRK